MRVSSLVRISVALSVLFAGDVAVAAQPVGAAPLDLAHLGAPLNTPLRAASGALAATPDVDSRLSAPIAAFALTAAIGSDPALAASDETADGALGACSAGAGAGPSWTAQQPTITLTPRDDARRSPSLKIDSLTAETGPCTSTPDGSGVTLSK